MTATKLRPRLLSVLLAVLSVCGGAFPAPTPLVFGRVHTAQPLVALTFDCCATRQPAGFDRTLVDYLRARKVPATFFLGGRWIETHPEAVRLLAGTPGFELESHSYLHPHLPKLTAEAVRKDLEKTQQLLQRATGHRGRYLRPPYGEWNRAVATTAAQCGLALVTWDVVTGDPDPHVSAADIARAVERARAGSIIIMHANGRGWHTAAALPQVLAVLKRKGLRPVTLRTLVALGKPEAVALDRHDRRR